MAGLGTLSYVWFGLFLGYDWFVFGAAEVMLFVLRWVGAFGLYCSDYRSV